MATTAISPLTLILDSRFRTVVLDSMGHDTINMFILFDNAGAVSYSATIVVTDHRSLSLRHLWGGVLVHNEPH